MFDYREGTCTMTVYLYLSSKQEIAGPLPAQVTPTDELVRSLDALQRLSGALWATWAAKWKIIPK